MKFELLKFHSFASSLGHFFPRHNKYRLMVRITLSHKYFENPPQVSKFIKDFSRGLLIFALRFASDHLKRAQLGLAVCKATAALESTL